jgi:hypothetical protein
VVVTASLNSFPGAQFVAEWNSSRDADPWLAAFLPCPVTAATAAAQATASFFTRRRQLFQKQAASKLLTPHIPQGPYNHRRITGILAAILENAGR